jgi:hypothetical protein
LFQFGLAIEDEAHAIARRVYEDGFPRVAIVQSDLDWSGRAAESFRSQFVRLGGTVVTVGTIQDARAVTEVVGNALLVGASTERMEALSKTLGSKPEFTARRRSDLDALVALTDPAQARALNSAMAFHFAADVPIYATSQATTNASSNDLGELNGFRITELPWQVYPSPIRTEVESAFANSRTSLSPLYALGVDAFRLSDRADLLIPSSPGRLLGNGQLQVSGAGVSRASCLALVQRGALVAMPTVRSEPTAAELGRRAERGAETYLRRRGLRILERNYRICRRNRSGHGRRPRSGARRGAFPESHRFRDGGDSWTIVKATRLIRAAQHYLRYLGDEAVSV